MQSEIRELKARRADLEKDLSKLQDCYDSCRGRYLAEKESRKKVEQDLTQTRSKLLTTIERTKSLEANSTDLGSARSREKDLRQNLEEARLKTQDQDMRFTEQVNRILVEEEKVRHLRCQADNLDRRHVDQARLQDELRSAHLHASSAIAKDINIEFLNSRLSEFQDSSARKDEDIRALRRVIENQSSAMSQVKVKNDELMRDRERLNDDRNKMANLRKRNSDEMEKSTQSMKRRKRDDIADTDAGEAEQEAAPKKLEEDCRSKMSAEAGKLVESRKALKDEEMAIAEQRRKVENDAAQNQALIGTAQKIVAREYFNRWRWLKLRPG